MAITKSPVVWATQSATATRPSPWDLLQSCTNQRASALPWRVVSARESGAGYIYAKAGLAAGLGSRFGRTYLSRGLLQRVEDFAFAGSDSESFGLAVVQKVDAYNRGSYTQATASMMCQAAVSNFQDVDVTFVGARWKF